MLLIQGLLSGLVLILLCFITPRLIRNDIQCGEFVQRVSRSNSAILGLSLLQNLYGAEAGKALAIPLPLMIIMYNICAPIILTHFSHKTTEAPSLREFGRKIFTNPFLIAALLGILTAATGLKFPTFLQKTVSNIGSIGSPLALVALGAITELEHLTFRKTCLCCIGFPFDHHTGNRSDDRRTDGNQRRSDECAALLLRHSNSRERLCACQEH